MCNSSINIKRSKVAALRADEHNAGLKHPVDAFRRQHGCCSAPCSQTTALRLWKLTNADSILCDERWATRRRPRDHNSSSAALLIPLDFLLSSLKLSTYRL